MEHHGAPKVFIARNEITNFCQRPDELLFKARERYKISIDRCPNHNMLPVTQIDTFYNGLTLRHRDTINAAAGRTFMKRRPEECYDLIKNMTAHHNDWDTSVQRSESSSSITSFSDMEIIGLNTEMAKINKNLIKALQLNQQLKAALITMKIVVVLILTMIVQPPLAKLRTYMLREPIIKVNQNRSNPNQNYQNQNRNQGNKHGIPQGKNQGRNQFFHGASHGQNPPPAYQAPAYQDPGCQALVHQALIPQLQIVTTTVFTNYMKANDAILKNMQTNMTSLTNSNLKLKNMFGQFMKMNTASSSGSRTLPSNTITNPKEDLNDRSISRPVRVAKVVFVKVGTFHFSTDFVVVDFDADPRVPLILRRSLLKTRSAFIDVYEGELTLRVGKDAVTFNLDQTLRYSANYDTMSLSELI
uniref:Reverse transcriptase domain-containing protein n=1 Tax=Tanacetum cinerariifolium TaxID=118510 RepID=A0A699HVW0_TANCI|nr:reverse transcriptase domain-containing protein [Tanacetum cinerariifolium]